MIPRRGVLIGTAALAALGIVGSSACSGPRPGGTAVAVATDSDGAPYWRLGAALAAVWGRDLDVRTRLLGGQGSVDNLAALRSGAADLAFCAADVAADAVTPLGDPAGRRVEALARMHDDAVHVVVPAASPARGLADLRGRRVSLGAPRSGVAVLAPRLLAAAGVDAGRDLVPAHLGVTDSAAALARGEIDAFFWSGGLPTAVVVRLAASHPIRLLDLAAVSPALRSTYPVYGATTIPAGVYGSPTPVTTVSVRNLLLVSDALPERTADGLTRVLLEDRDEIARAEAIGRAIDPLTAIGTQPVPLHPGAVAAFRAYKTRS